MREAIGGLWLYYIFVVMIMFIVSFLAVMLNYMSAYRANNHLISVLEQSEGIMPVGIEKKLNASFNYANDFNSCYMVQPNGKGFIIRVATFMAIRIPLVNIDLKVPVKNETRTINCYGSDNCPSRTVLDSLKTTKGEPQLCNVGW